MIRTKPRVNLQVVCPECGTLDHIFDLGQTHLRQQFGAVWPAHRRQQHRAWPASRHGTVIASMAICGTTIHRCTTSETSYDGAIRRLRDEHVATCEICRGGQLPLLEPQS